jgi:hypothetical protein
MKKIIGVILGILVLILLTIWAYSALYAKPVEQNSNVNVEQTENSDWLTYRNERHLFTLKYPNTTDVSIEWGNGSDKIMTNEFYVAGLYAVIVDEDGLNTLDKFMQDKVGNENYNTLFEINNGKVVQIIDDKSVIFQLKDGKVLHTVLYADAEMAFIEGEDYYLWMTSKIGSIGNGVLSEEEIQIIKSVEL